MTHRCLECGNEIAATAHVCSRPAPGYVGPAPAARVVGTIGPKPIERAFLLAWIDTSSRHEPVMKGFGVYSSKQPSCLGQGVWAYVASGWGIDYESAVADLKKTTEAYWPQIAAKVPRW